MADMWVAKLDTYLDGELPAEEMRAADSHVRSCADCAAEVMNRVQMKRALLGAGKRYEPRAEFRDQIAQMVGGKRAAQTARSFRWSWLAVGAMALVLAVGAAWTYRARQNQQQAQVFGELADLHVATLASANPIDVVSTDRHTVKPWFQGRIPFAFNLPELRNSEFSLLGGRMTYLDQTPGAHLIYDVGKHHISVFVFQEWSLPARLNDRALQPGKLSFNMETWSQGGLRYFVIGDASPANIDSLAKLFKAAS